MLLAVKFTRLSYQSIDKYVAFLAILEVQCGCPIRTLIKLSNINNNLIMEKCFLNLRLFCLNRV